ncbi:NlpC/P60 family putative phage cell wall peptidase [Shimia abyssi]|uniref:NlpC/P60 family putative phage cell wall peptidase n=1 Tax=Shimia abyssi TaxID=1662395 RepID=A0A2P8FFT7_9RHOB|nr:NlpC/P60 family putative phage cell wall peptidase [Shimia abyssi]
MVEFSNRIISEARSWIGTPYVHQASCKGGGTDCLGLVRGVWRSLYRNEPELVPAYSRDWSEPQGDERLWRAAASHMMSKSISDASPGDL